MIPETEARPERAKMIRAFISVEIPDEIKGALQDIQQAFRESRDRITWVRPQGMHITLKFLGDIEEGSIPEIGARMQKAGDNIEPFVIHLLGAGVFPGMKKPRVLWAGIREGAEDLKKIQEDLDSRLEDLGFPISIRPFSPHITIGRIKDIRDPRWFAAQMEKHGDTEIGSMRAESIHLFESRLRPDGAVYTERFFAPLGGAKGLEI